MHSHCVEMWHSSLYLHVNHGALKHNHCPETLNLRLHRIFMAVTASLYSCPWEILSTQLNKKCSVRQDPRDVTYPKVYTMNKVVDTVFKKYDINIITCNSISLSSSSLLLYPVLIVFLLVLTLHFFFFSGSHIFVITVSLSSAWLPCVIVIVIFVIPLETIGHDKVMIDSTSLKARLMGPTFGPPGTQVGPM